MAREQISLGRNYQVSLSLSLATDAMTHCKRVTVLAKVFNHANFSCTCVSSLSVNFFISIDRISQLSSFQFVFLIFPVELQRNFLFRFSRLSLSEASFNLI